MKKKIRLLLTGCVLGFFAGKYFFENLNKSTIRGYSMYPTISDKDYVYDESLFLLKYRLERNDIVIVRDPNNNERLVKRIVGIPGEIYTDQDGIENKIEDEKYFVLGDNRRISHDSRDFGPVSVETKVQIIVKTYAKADLGEFLEAVSPKNPRGKDKFQLKGK